MRIEDLDTPVPVIDGHRVEHNLTKMQAVAIATACACVRTSQLASLARHVRMSVAVDNPLALDTAARAARGIRARDWRAGGIRQR